MPAALQPLNHSVALADRSSWMRNLKTHRLYDICIPGTHHSGTYRVASGTSQQFAARRWAQCQHLSVYEQLSGGVRFLDVRLCPSSKPQENGRLYASHSKRVGSRFFELLFAPVDEIMESIYAFVKRHPTEIVIIQIRKDWDAPNIPLDAWSTLWSRIEKAFKGRIIPFSERNLQIGELTSRFGNLVVISDNLLPHSNSVAWPLNHVDGSWTKTNSPSWKQLLRRMTLFVQQNKPTFDASSMQMLQCEITQNAQTFVASSVRYCAQWANAVLLLLLRASWTCAPLQCVTHDFANDLVLAALIDRNFRPNIPPPLSPLSRNQELVAPSVLNHNEVLCSSNREFFLTLSPTGIASIIGRDGVRLWSSDQHIPDAKEGSGAGAQLSIMRQDWIEVHDAISGQKLWAIKNQQPGSIVSMCLPATRHGGKLAGGSMAPSQGGTISRLVLLDNGEVMIVTSDANGANEKVPWVLGSGLPKLHSLMQ